MKRYLTAGIIFGVAVIAIVTISWVSFPAWHDPASGGFWGLLGATLLGVLPILQGVISIWKDLKDERRDGAIQSITSQNAQAIYNLSGGTINFVPPTTPPAPDESITGTPEEVATSDEEIDDVGDLASPVVDGLNWEVASTAVIFDGRLRDAFPGLRSIQRLEGDEAIDRLLILLRHPLGVALNKRRVYPFWWFRGRSNSTVREFERLDTDRVLMNNIELQVEYIVAVRAFSAEDRNFVYVQVLPENPTGLYKYSEGWIDGYLQERLERNWGYYFYEEYGIWKDRFITREEYDDNAAMIDGKPTDIGGAKPRVRYLTPYNFVICGQQHVLNNTGEVDMQTTKLMDEILLGSKTVDDLVDYVDNLQGSPRFW
jgi:hypothetical protein